MNTYWFSLEAYTTPLDEEEGEEIDEYIIFRDVSYKYIKKKMICCSFILKG